MKANDFDLKFDQNTEDVVEDLDLTTTRKPLKDTRRVNVDFPAWIVDSLDCEARRLGVTRQSIIKIWIAERLEQTTRSHGAEIDAAGDRAGGRAVR
jgi:hypothetical protein